MQLRHLAIPQFRNLRGVAIDFATQLVPAPGAPRTQRQRSSAATR